MNDRILIDVLTLEGEGLVGFTELGRQVLLIESGKKHQTVRRDLDDPPITREYMRESALRVLRDGEYGRLVKLKKGYCWNCVVYLERK